MMPVSRYSRARERLWATGRGRLMLVGVAVSIVVVGIGARAVFDDGTASVLAVGYILIAGAVTIWLADRQAPPR